MLRGFLRIAAALATATVLATDAVAAEPGASAMAADAAIGGVIGEHTLVDQDGRRFTTGELSGKPYALTFVYTGCGHTCPLILTGLKRALSASPDFGVKFTALTVGIDAGVDTPKAMKAMGAKVASDFRKWRFASGDKEAIEGLAKAAGFYYKKTGDDYEHMNLVTIIGPDGRVFKQVYGAQFSPEDILGPLYGSIKYAGRPAPPWVKGGAEMTLLDRIKLLCYTYDEKTGTYRLDYGFLIVVAVTAFVQTTILFVVAYIYMSRKKNKRIYRPTIVFKDGPASKKPL